MNSIEQNTGAHSQLRPAALAILCLGVIVAQVDTSVVNLAVQPIGVDLKASVTELQWVVDAYNLVYAALLISGGLFADLYGRRLMFIIGCAVFAFGEPWLCIRLDHCDPHRGESLDRLRAPPSSCPLPFR
ncbi:MFS transporter [Rhizobium leguminosarum]|uniref:MFS transporter n=1 Tax=Rhizobium leguminosarum TaxID=384 RepID=UPI0021BBF304|nr:MFS transporter [Rhizobium leguminosarum]